MQISLLITHIKNVTKGNIGKLAIEIALPVKILAKYYLSGELSLSNRLEKLNPTLIGN